MTAQISLELRGSEQINRMLRGLEDELGPRNVATIARGAINTPVRRLRPKLEAITRRGVYKPGSEPPEAARLVNAVQFRSVILPTGAIRSIVGYRIRRQGGKPGQRVSKVLGLEYGNSRQFARRPLRLLWEQHRDTVTRQLHEELGDLVRRRVRALRRRIQRGTARVR